MRACAVSRRYINVCNCDMFSVVNVYIDHLKSMVCVLMVKGMYVVVNIMFLISNECNEPTPALVQPIGTHGGEVMRFFCLGVSLVS